jgi:hypothetical protein
MGEDEERLAMQGPAGPQGEKGNRGEKGTAGLSRSVRRALVVLFCVAVLLAGLGLFWAAHDQDASFAAQQREQAEQRAAQLKQSRAICLALVGLDDASHGAEFATAAHTGIPLSRSYGYRLSLAIHGVVKATDCAQLLSGKLPG